MRRSQAPSQKDKFVSPLLHHNSSSPRPGTIVAEGKISNLSCQTTDTIHKFLINKVKRHDSEKQNNVKSFEETKNNETIDKKVFNVVYGKPSKKKHKTWEGDGYLEIGIKTVTLKDNGGKILGTSSNVKIAELTEGSRIFVGSKEVELIDLVVGDLIITNKRVREENDVEKVETPRITLKKRLKPLPNNNGNDNSTLSDQSKNKSNLSSNIEPLVMPRPGDQHQWEFNINYQPVTDVIVDHNLNRHLRPHQREGVAFLYRCVTGIRSLNYTGAILADEMGLGKTLQTITVIWTLLRKGPYGGTPLLKKVLIVVPSSLVQNWQNEFLRWIGTHRIRLFVVDKKNKSKDYVHSNCPVMIISYDQLVRNIDDIRCVEFDLIVCDEGHRLKNSGIQATSHLSSMLCKQRILLTGTPIQNDLQEYYTLVDFVNPGILGTPSEFRKNFAHAIIASRDPKASDDIVQEGKDKADELNRFTNGFILRRTQSIIGSFLPQKNEYVVFCAATPLQKHIYSMVSKIWLERMEDKSDCMIDVNHLTTVTMLKKICNHPVLISSNKIEDRIDVFSKVFDEEMQSYTFKEIDSGKLSLVVTLLNKLSGTGERIVLVSNFTQTLDLFATMCENYKYNYLRFDGSTASTKRSEIVDRFNSKNSDVYVLLLSSKAGGVGLNLIGGTRLILYDSDWNPAVDLQAMARIWREGQNKNVHIYRLLTTGTIEEKIFQRQLTKAGLSESIVDPCSKTSVKLSKEEIMDLFDFTGEDKCLTHKTLKCKCNCDGSIPLGDHYKNNVVEEEEEEERDCQLTLDINNYSMPSLRMNQLYHWEHHGVPVQSHLLQDMKLGDSQPQINFVFRNKTN